MGASKSDELQRGRDAYADSAWSTAYESLRAADDAEDLELLAISAYMLGREDEWIRILERAYHRHAELGARRRAARCAFWIGMHLALRGQTGPATGWLGRAQRLVDRESECVEQGYMLMPVVFQHEAEGDLDGAVATAAAAAEIAERFGDKDLFALAVHTQGEIRVRGGRVREGLALLDEAMVAVTEGELSPVVTGIVYCGVIHACEEVYELRRAREWTAALTRWCERQEDLVAFTGRCLVHRAQILQLQGAWPDALAEIDRAGRRYEKAMNPAAVARAYYLRGEVHRLRGELTEAEEAYRQSSRVGAEPQPGLALLRLAQGDAAAAAAAMRRALGETAHRLRRASLLPAYAEIMLAAGKLDEARRACSELDEIAAQCESEMLHAAAAHARGAVELAAGDADAALASLRRAAHAWHELEAPHEAARARVLVGRACRALGDEEGFSLELDAARSVFEELGAAPDAAAVDALTGSAGRDAHGLTAREREVLRLVARGKSNREIAAALVISEHTVARHLQNIFRKLDVPSRAAAAAFAFEHGLAG
ncbi:MAG TPA: LuxR C-terminal-related transcriptional regulator [Gaiellaceae bacterium]|nr:LuxR C-terminal-related transcriptional regulator [Gaiellaceae bacterium]